MPISVLISNTPPDLACLLRLSQQCGLAINETTSSGLLEKHKRVFWIIAEDKHQAIGLMRLSMRVPGIAFISNFVVDPSQQGIGIGSKMLLAAEKTCLKKRERLLVLESVTVAESYYLKRGFIKKQPFPPTYTKLLTA